MLILVALITGLLFCVALVSVCITGMNKLYTNRVFCEDLLFLLEETPALYAFAIIVMQAEAALSQASLIRRISNHLVISLDIAYLLNIRILIFLHHLKISAPSLQSVML